jgi:hypothetical protein
MLAAGENRKLFYTQNVQFFDPLMRGLKDGEGEDEERQGPERAVNFPNQLVRSREEKHMPLL